MCKARGSATQGVGGSSQGGSRMCLWLCLLLALVLVDTGVMHDLKKVPLD